jgi:hypothetical protein
MDASIGTSVLVCALLAGCGSSVQVGLANAPILGGATPETRVHDVIANGRDSCERSAFPQGHLLRGQIPTCGPKQRVTLTRAEPWTGPANSWNLRPYSLGDCPSGDRAMSKPQTSLVAVSLSSSGRLCREPW